MDKILKNALKKIGEFSVKNKGTVFFLGLVLILISLVGASRVSMSMGMDDYIDEESQTNKDWQLLQEKFGKGNEIFIKIETENEIYEVENMEMIEDIYQGLYDTEKFTFVTSPAHPVKSGPGQGELLEEKDGIINSIQKTRENHRTADVMIQSLIPDENTGIIIAQYGNLEVEGSRLGGLIPISQEEVVEKEVKNALEQVEIPEEASLTVTGAPIFEEAAFGLMLPEMIELFGYAIIVIVIVVFLIMKNKVGRKREVALPFITTAITILAMTGFMGFLGYDFNAIMLGVLPVALGLSIDYGLQVQSRFLEERESGEDLVDSATATTARTGKALLFAMATTLIGLGALLISEVPPVRQFGVTAGFSILVAMILSVTLLISLLSLFSERKSTARKENLLESKICSFSTFVCKRKVLFLTFFGIIVLLGLLAYPRVETTQEMFDYWPEIEEKNNLENLEDLVQSPKIIHAIVEFENNPYNPEYFSKIYEFESELEDLKHVNTVLSPARAMIMGEGAIPEDGEEFSKLLESENKVDRPPTLGRNIEDYGNKVLVQMFIEDIEGKPVRTLINEIEEVTDQKLEADLAITGKPVLNRVVIENVTADLTKMTVLSFSLVLAFLSIVLWSVKYSFILVFGVSVSAVALTTGSMYIFGIPWNPLTVTVASIILGIGVDYGVHIYERYLEEKTDSVLEAITKSTSKKARPILGSGLTTMLGFGVLIISDFPVLANFGKAIVLAMIFALASTFLILPPLMFLADKD